MLNKNKVVVAMSGGVDSTVAAYLLKKSGMEVTGLFMNVWHSANQESEKDFLKVCKLLDIPSIVLDLREEFKKNVIDYFVSSYEKGETPNPCIECNKHIKFGVLLDEAKKMGAYYLATGHYAKIVKEDNIYYIEKAKAKAKDQTYMFYNFNQEILEHILMPLGEFDSKDEIRKIANMIDMTISNKSDSQEICFIPDNDYVSFLQDHNIKTKDGEFIDLHGKTIGKHKGIIHYTIGQRKGLGVTFGKPTYVVDIKSGKNEIVLGDNESLFVKGLIANNFNFVSNNFIPNKVYTTKIRYTGKETNCTIEYINKTDIKVVFETKLRAITPGQSIVFYDGNRLLGGAIIKNRLQ